MRCICMIKRVYYSDVTGMMYDSYADALHSEITQGSTAVEPPKILSEFLQSIQIGKQSVKITKIRRIKAKNLK